ncbi:MAG TPA: Asp-tRNA(Asn)/Glu-tRNA(Gln) amidotransferase GatCAB subunit A [Lachnospiraceae bacterium]|jgi:aspartyl-tRNA(Asn)/glutamyl-tRNA(Gln) amidotransferase subunit A|nr:Asp-tRNA(Asn)/Glu-tRNA(Gln) amidotransferase GatCAB subunit A [Lachnospiraceae bacterium]HCM14065.1 Asp-tRNA(Asn)/Glu-tRNA(Gln) amidotransferase GatCAB subunit A [Lachnospiraceae bacterium]HCR39648.1 Asp-tRNA(Asn)/Glu-tRNA(Gln) amidotransferase GatCAB subunit A [Lachnospiraceae bacterium]
MKDIRTLSALELGKLINDKKISVVEATKAQLDVIRQRETSYHCYITLLEEEALAQAIQVQKRIDQGELAHSPLAGVPMAIKDNICMRNVKTTCASRMLYNFEPPYDATAVERLKSAGAVILGKTNMDEFAMGSTTETSFFGATKNPWNTSHVPGGSSGGSAAAVAAEEAYYALGSDTGGSIRQPAGYCGVTGIKPTYGTVSRYGLIAYASSLDQIGPLGRTVSDCAAVLEAISGRDRKDSTSLSQTGYDYMDALVDDVRGMRIGIPKGYLGSGVEEEIKDHIDNAVKILTEKGARVEEFDLEAVDYAVPAYYVIACAEASSNLSRFDGVKYGYQSSDYEGLQELYKNSRSEGFGEEVKRRMLIGAFVLSSGYYDAFYTKALKVRTLINQGFQKAFDRYDMILGPISPQTAPKLGESLSDPLKMYLSDIFTVSVNLAGLPAISLPCGRDQRGLPIGLQLIGKHFGEKDIIRAAYSLEQAVRYARPTTLM